MSTPLCSRDSNVEGNSTKLDSGTNNDSTKAHSRRRVSMMGGSGNSSTQLHIVLVQELIWKANRMESEGHEDVFPSSFGCSRSDTLMGKSNGDGKMDAVIRTWGSSGHSNPSVIVVPASSLGTSPTTLPEHGLSRTTRLMGSNSKSEQLGPDYPRKEPTVIPREIDINSLNNNNNNVTGSISGACEHQHNLFNTNRVIPPSITMKNDSHPGGTSHHTGSVELLHSIENVETGNDERIVSGVVEAEVDRSAKGMLDGKMLGSPSPDGS